VDSGGFWRLEEGTLRSCRSCQMAPMIMDEPILR
jgi:hypothetical protein